MTRGQGPAQPARGSEQPFGSTTWEWRQVKISRAPQATGTDGRKAGRWHSLPGWPVRRPLTLTVKYRGGPEGWVEIHSRGRVGRFPGTVAIFDVLREVWNEPSPK